jgi:hypothetical protein
MRVRQLLVTVLLLALPTIAETNAEIPKLKIREREPLLAVQRLIIDAKWAEAHSRIVAILQHDSVDTVVMHSAVRLYDRIPLKERPSKFKFEKSIESLEIGTHVVNNERFITGRFLLRAKTVPTAKIDRIRVRAHHHPTDLFDSKRDCDLRSTGKPGIECISRPWEQTLNGPGLYEIRVESSAGESVDNVVLSEAATNPHILNLKRPAASDRLVAPKIPYEIAPATFGEGWPDEIKLELSRGSGNLKQWTWTNKDIVPSGVLEAPVDGSLAMSLIWKKRTAVLGALSVYAEGWTGKTFYLMKSP